MIKILVKLCNRDSRTVYRDDLCYELADMLQNLPERRRITGGMGNGGSYLRTLASTLIGRAIEKGLFEDCARVNVYPVSFKQFREIDLPVILSYSGTVHISKRRKQ